MPYASNDGVRIHYELMGVGPLVALMHGIGSTSQIWHSNGAIERFARHYTVLTIDSRGLGKSDHPPAPADYRRELRRDDTIAVLDAIGAEAVNLVGYSLGGRSAIYVATKQPERVQSVVAVASNPYPTPMNLELTAAERQQAARPPKPVRAFLRARRMVRSRLPGRARRLSIDELIRRADPRPFDIEPAVEAMTMPSYFISGEFDERFAVELTRQFAERLSAGRFEAIPGENHGMLPRLGPVLPKIEAFLAEVTAPTG